MLIESHNEGSLWNVCRNEVLIALEEKREVKWKQKEVRVKSRGSSGFRLADYKWVEDERKEEKEVEKTKMEMDIHYFLVIMH